MAVAPSDPKFRVGGKVYFKVNGEVYRDELSLRRFVVMMAHRNLEDDSWTYSLIDASHGSDVEFQRVPEDRLLEASEFVAHLKKITDLMREEAVETFFRKYEAGDVVREIGGDNYWEIADWVAGAPWNAFGTYRCRRVLATMGLIVMPFIPDVFEFNSDEHLQLVKANNEGNREGYLAQLPLFWRLPELHEKLHSLQGVTEMTFREGSVEMTLWKETGVLRIKSPIITAMGNGKKRSGVIENDVGASLKKKAKTG